MHRWWGAAAGLGRRVLSSSGAGAGGHARPPSSAFHSLRAPPPLFSLPTPVTSPPPLLHLHRPLVPQVRHYAAKERSRAPRTPTTSKLKKYKMKAPSSMKFRFRTMKDGQIRRWRAGKRHNAHLKSKEAKRRLRKPALVHLAYAKVIKKLNFCG